MTERKIPPSKRRKALARRKPGPRPRPVPLEGRDYYCGTCAGHRRVYCPDCVAGCRECSHTGFTVCPQCAGGSRPVHPPEWDARA